MKKRYVFLIVVTLLIGVPILRFIASKKQMEQEMKEAVYDSMITELIKKNIKEYDPNAFTDDGIIKSYEIDSETISQNPMGGIGFLIYVNNLSDLYVIITLHSNNGGGLVVNSFNPSPELINLLEEKYGQIY
jgi:complete genome